MKTSAELLLIFTRNPELGKCKTRLAAKVGDYAALDIYKFLLKHTVSFTKDLKTDKQVHYSETIWNDDVWDAKTYEKKLQVGENLGDRMLYAFKQGFEAGYEKIVIIGSDMYDLNEASLEHAFQLLEANDYVVGPAEDGGYYLLGMKQLKKELFENKEWGTSSVLNKTLNDLSSEKYALLETRNDIDYYEDIANLEAFQPFIKHVQK